MTEMTCETCTAFRICPHEPKREDYTDENKYLIDLESGVWSCKRTIQELCKENEALKEQVPIWHDLRKDPNDLPNDDRFVLNEAGVRVFCLPSRRKWFRVSPLKPAGEVIAWCDIPVFKGE